MFIIWKVGIPKSMYSTSDKEWIHLSWGILWYFFCIASMTIDELSMLTISLNPSLIICSDISAKEGCMQTLQQEINCKPQQTTCISNYCYLIIKNVLLSRIDDRRFNFLCLHLANACSLSQKDNSNSIFF